MLLNDKVSFRIHWPSYADLRVNGILHPYLTCLKLLFLKSLSLAHVWYLIRLTCVFQIKDYIVARFWTV